MVTIISQVNLTDIVIGVFKFESADISKIATGC